MFSAAIERAMPERCLPPYLPTRPTGRVIVIGAGKSSAEMARVVEREWAGPLSGLVVTRYGHSAPCERIEVVEASHPVPDEAGEKAAARILAMVHGLTADDLVLCLISGGGSALLALPAGGITLADKQEVSRALLHSGATISEMNCVRKHLSAIKGGQLAAAAHPARVVTLLVSDVPGDDPAVIASGPTVADPTTFADAAEVLRRYGITAPASVMAHIAAAARETPKPGDARLARAEHHVIAAPMQSLEAAATVARAAGFTPVILGDAIEGEARVVAAEQAALVQRIRARGDPVAAPCVLLSGGETTVTVRGTGRGGRNAEYLLSLAVALHGEPSVFALAGDTDGIDGTEDNAGALLGPDTLARAALAGVEATAALANNDGYGFFAAASSLVVTGPTRTNVNDFRAILISG